MSHRHAASFSTDAPLRSGASFRVAAVAACASVALLVGGWCLLAQSMFSPAAQARDDVAHAIDEHRCHLMGTDADPHIDTVTGLVVHEAEFYGAGETEYGAAFNAEMRERLAAGETCEPRFLDRVTTRDDVRARFARDGRRAVALPPDRPISFGRRVAELRSTRICVAESGASFDDYDHGPPGAYGEFADVAATTLVSDDDRTLFIRLATSDGIDHDYFVFDLETGWLLYRFRPTP